jgi:hypothetical protein
MIDGEFPAQAFKAFVDDFVRARCMPPAIRKMNSDLGHQEANQQCNKGIFELGWIFKRNEETKPENYQCAQAGILSYFRVTLN